MSRMHAQPRRGVETGAADPRQPSPQYWLTVIHASLHGARALTPRFGSPLCEAGWGSHKVCVPPQQGWPG